jgi:hypothetical protein
MGENMPYQSVFKRYELKYLVSLEQKTAIINAIAPYMELDKYGRTTIRNVYFDTDSYRLIRRSIEKPMYKEKLRIRSYRRADADSPVFVELKRKYDGIVYKRRLALPEKEAMDWVMGERHCHEITQISREIDYFLQYYGCLRPTAFLSYEREAYYCRGGGDFRVTFDDNILARDCDLSLRSETYGKSLLDEGRVLMEIKCSGGIPLWMVSAMSREKIRKTSFSKYGIAYQNIIYPRQHKKNISDFKEEIHNVS